MISRRWRLSAALTALGSVALGLAALLQDNSYWSSVLIEVGAAVVLLAPLLVVEQRFEQRQQELSDRIEQVAQRVERLRLDQVDQATQARVEQATKEDEALFRAFEEQPSFETARALLRRAQQLNAIEPERYEGGGIRAGIPDHYLRPQIMLRLRLAGSGLFPRLNVEDRDGQRQGDWVYWDGSETAADAMGNVAIVLQSIDRYSPASFQPERTLKQLLDTLRLAIESRTGVSPFKIREPVVERPSDNWVITTSALRHIETNVVVTKQELQSRDGREGLRREILARTDIGNTDDFNAAWATAVELFTNDRLSEPG
jgi:hypothetical protein